MLIWGEGKIGVQYPEKKFSEESREFKNPRILADNQWPWHPLEIKKMQKVFFLKGSALVLIFV